MRKSASLLFLLAWLLFPIAGKAAEPAMDKFLALGTASVSGVYHPVGKALCDLVNNVRLRELIRCIAYSTGGSEYNIRAVASGELSLGITRTDLGYDAYHGLGDFVAHGPSPSLRQVMSLYDEPVTMIVKRSAGIGSFEEIVGKRVNIGNRGSSQRGIVRMILDAANLSARDFASYRELATSEMGEAFCKGEIDVMFQALGGPAPFFKTMIEQCDGAIFPIPPAVIARILEKHPTFMRMDIPGGQYPGHADPVPSFGMKTTLVSSDKVSPESIRRLLRAVFEQLPQFKAAHPALQSLDGKKMAAEGILIPLHDGATSYYAERGIR